MKQRVLDGLLSSNYFRDATCRQFSDYMLEKNGLPRLGQSGPVKGTRDSTNRQGENKSPPEFFDSLLIREKPLWTYRIDAKGDRAEWTVSVRREIPLEGKLDAKSLAIDTTFHFENQDYRNVGTCSLKGFDFHAGSVSRKLNLDACLGVMIDNEPNRRTVSAEAYAVQHYLLEDCTVGMHYSNDAKKIFKTPLGVTPH